MNVRSVERKEAIILLAALLFGLILSSFCVAWADPGMGSNLYHKTVYVDFSGFPNGGAVREGIDEWRAQGWNEGARSLQLIRAGGYLEIVVQVPSGVSAGRLTIAHRSGCAPGCANNGFAPVALIVNGVIFAQNYAPQAGNPWSTGFTTDSCDVTSAITSGNNRIRITAGTLCSVYEINRLELAITADTPRLVEAYQMTHAIASNRPVDNVAAFSPSDRWAVCWIKVASEAIGKRIEWRFYDPSGSLYFKTDREANRYNWGYIRVRDWRAATLHGQWRVDIYIAGKFQGSVPFTIGAIGCSNNAPRVTLVEFPSAIRADGEKTRGYVSFFDPNGDIAFVKFDVVTAVCFTPFSFEPNVEGKTSGTFDFRIWCSTKQTVTLKVTLYDRQGNKSEPYYFSFNAT